ncbi:MAG TPA: A/G-specific adenine glycosylase [Deltaproteobacteria bacterium]|nr:A/G-specific adenine glycosylase [Deltaproteobacteria bacterium]
MKLDHQLIETFRQIVDDHYRLRGRRLPWRETTDPYHILVSEIMLQQTQVQRVWDKFTEFVGRFPDVPTLSSASMHDVLETWQGLGYNRRARSLKESAELIMERHQGKVPDEEASLVGLPGVGTATARAVQAFAFNKPVVFIETNIRTVYLHHFFEGRERVPDRELEPFVEQTLDRENPRRWYNALMDYGVFLKHDQGNPSRASYHYTRQSPFEGSTRQVRGAVLRRLLNSDPVPYRRLAKELPFENSRVEEALRGLEADGLITRRGSRVSIDRERPVDGKATTPRSEEKDQ